MNEASLSRGSPLRFALRRLLRHKWSLGWALFWSVLFVLTPMQIPVITGVVIDNLRGKQVRLYGIQLDSDKDERLQNVGLATVVLLGVAAVRGVSAYLRLKSTNQLARRFVGQTRNALIKRVTMMPLESHCRIGAGELLHRVVVDTSALRRFVSEVVIQAATSVFRLVCAATLLFFHDALMAAVVCSVIPVQWLCHMILERKTRAARRAVRKTQSRLTTLVKEQLDGTETIQSLGACDLAVRRTRRKVKRLEHEQLVQADCSAMKSGLVWFLTSLGFGLTWGMGAMRVLDSRMSVGELVTFAGLVVFAYVPFRRVAGAMAASPKILTSLKRLEELLHQGESPMERPDARPLVVEAGRMELRQVTFGYGAEPVLRKASLVIEPNCITAVAGSSGAGKSSLLRLLNRLYDPQEGEVLIDGVDVRQFTLASLRSTVALVPQQPMIFTGSLAANLRLARPDATDKELLAACDAADLTDFLQRMQDGLQTRIGRRRAQLSGGEAQRLAIARALLMRSKILLLDEPTSALDMRSQATIMDTLARLKSQMTIVVAGHRLEMLQQADRLIFLEEGGLVDHGQPDSRLASLKLYGSLPHSNAHGQGTGPTKETMESNEIIQR